jgi:hypothetical protein
MRWAGFAPSAPTRSQTHSEVTAEAIKQAINIVDYQAGVLKLHSMQEFKARTTPSPAPPANTAPGKGPAAPSAHI